MTAQTLENLGQLFRILDHRHSLTESSTERSFLKIVLGLTTNITLLI